MNKTIRLLYKILYKFGVVSNVNIARSLGVKFGAGCKFLDDPFYLFGTEPYLIELGDNVELTNGVSLITHDGSMWVLRNKYPEICSKLDFFGKITIGSNVFVGVKSIILPGVTIGSNVIIGAGSVVTKNIPDNCVYAGVPARFIKPLDEYKAKTLEVGAENTKNISAKEKELYLRNKYPEWFGKFDIT